MRDDDDQVVAALIVIVDIDEEKHTTERQVMLTREVDHRAKNMLAVVQAALRLTRADDVASYIEIIEGRVKALARAQSLLAVDRWTGADLRRLLQGEFAAFLNKNASGPRVELRGPRLTLPAKATQPFYKVALSWVLGYLTHGPARVGRPRDEVWRLIRAATGRLSVEWQVVRIPGRRPAAAVDRNRWTTAREPPAAPRLWVARPGRHAATPTWRARLQDVEADRARLRHRNATRPAEVDERCRRRRCPGGQSGHQGRRTVEAAFASRHIRRLSLSVRSMPHKHHLPAISA